MKWFPFFKSKPKNNAEERIDRYKEWRATGRALNLTLIKQLPKTAVPECGKKIGLFKAGTLILNNDDEIAVLYDYCLHHYLRAGKNAIERYRESLTEVDSRDAVLLDAMQDSRYSVFRVLEIHPHQGASLLDLVQGDSLELMDISVSETGEPGMVLSGRLLKIEDFHMSSGTLIPLPDPVFDDKIKPILRKFLKSDEPGEKPKLSPGQRATFTAEILRVSLHAGGEDNVFYTDMEH